LFPKDLFPSIDGLHLEALHIDTQSITAVLAVATAKAACPLCGEPAMRVHSRYIRTATDLPWAGIRVHLQITVRRFFCDNATCSWRIFAERLGEALPAFARRTNRLAKALCAIAFAAGGEGGARLAHAQAMPVSPRSLLRLLESSFLPATSPPRVVGIDEWGATRRRRCSRKDSRKEALTWGSAPKCPTRLNQVRLGQCSRVRQGGLETVRKRDDC